MNMLPRVTAWIPGLVLIPVVIALGGCKGEESGPPGTTQPGAAATITTKPPAAGFEPPELKIDTLPFALQVKISAARREAREASDNATKLADLGALCYVHGFPEAAVVCFERAAALEPDDFRRCYFLGLAQDKAGNRAAAIAAFERVLVLNAEHRPARVRLGALLLGQDPARAAEQFRAVVEAEANPNKIAARYGLGRCARRGGRLDEAAEHYRGVLKMAPAFGPAHAALAEVLDAQGKADQAEQHRRRATDDDQIRPLIDILEGQLLQAGQDVQALISTATAMAQQRQLDQAERLLREAMDIDGSNLLARNTYAMVLGMQGRQQDAIREFEAILNLPEGRDFTPARINLALVLLSLQELDRAEALLREALAKEPTNREALSVYCSVAAQRKAPDLALPPLNAALAAAPQDAAVHYQVGVLLRELGRPAEAEDTVRRALELDPNLTSAREILGMWLFQDGNSPAARKQWTEALRIDPTLVRPRAALLGILIGEKDHAAAERLLREGLEAVPESPELMNYLAWQLATCADPDYRNAEEALQLAEKASAATGHRSHMMLDTLAAAYASAGRFDEARVWIVRAIAAAKQANAERDVYDFSRRRELYEQDKPFYEER